MAPTEIFRGLLVVLLVACAIGAVLSKKPLTGVIIFMSYSGFMAIVWALLRSPDLAITEAAVGAGVSTVLFFICLRRLGGTEKADRDDGTSRKKRKKEAPGEPNGQKTARGAHSDGEISESDAGASSGKEEREE